MKNIFKYILLILPILVLWSCQDDDDLVIANPISAPIVLEAESNDVNLDPNYKNNPALTLAWSHADYDVQTIPQYSIWFALDEAFETGQQVFNTTSRNKTWTVEELNILVQGMGMAPNEIGTLFAKVKSSLGDRGQLSLESNQVFFEMTPYTTYSFKDYYLVGNATAAGWNPNNNNQAIFRDPNNENQFSFTGYFDHTSPGDINEGRFKLVEGPDWQPQWGDERNEGEDTQANSGNVAGNPATQSNDPGRFGVPSAGYFTFNINFETLTYNIEPYDASSAAVYNRVGIIGDATSTGWDGDTAMMRNESFDPHNWYLLNVELGNGELKFRANDAWDVSWGSTTSYSGVGELGGPNIPVTAGTYNIWFNDLTGEYQLIPQD